MDLPLDKLVKQKFGLHRGVCSDTSEENSLQAIKKAADLEPLWIEFDVVLSDDKELKTGHPPRFVSNFEEILSLFKNKKTYPKIDLKLREEKEFYPLMIDRTLDLVASYNIKFALISITGDKEHIIESQNYLFQKIKNNPKIKLNIDLAKYEEIGENPEELETHIKTLSDIIYCLSPEIHEDNWNTNAQFAEKHQIKNIHFWLRSWPDVLNPKVNETTIRKALKLEDRYNIKVRFDINPQHIETSSSLVFLDDYK